MRPELCNFERLRQRRDFGVPVHVSGWTSEEEARWLSGYAVFDMIHRHGHSVGHSFLQQQLDQMLPAFEVKQGLEVMRSEKLIESVNGPGELPWRPIAHYRLISIESHELVELPEAVGVAGA